MFDVVLLVVASLQALFLEQIRSEAQVLDGFTLTAGHFVNCVQIDLQTSTETMGLSRPFDPSGHDYCNGDLERLHHCFCNES